jgi:hypothetical protein
VLLQVLLVVAVEHVLLFLKYWLESIVPRMPDTVSATQCTTTTIASTPSMLAFQPLGQLIQHSADVIALIYSMLACRH